MNGSLAGNDLAKAQLAASTNINAFRFYGESSTSNVATIALDNIRWYNTCTLPPTHLALVSVPTTGTVGSNLTSFTTEARSGSSSGPVANSFTGAITVAKVSGAGSISGTTAPNATAGVAAFVSCVKLQLALVHLSAYLHGTLGCLNKHAAPLAHLGKNRQITSVGAS